MEKLQASAKDLPDLKSLSLDEYSESTNPKLSAFERFPGEIRNEIYSYLLDSDASKNFDPKHWCNKYIFHPAILGVNKQIYREAHSIFYRKNNIITAVIYDSNVRRAMDVYEVAYHSSRYSQSVHGRLAHVVIKPRWLEWDTSVENRKPQVFVLVGPEIKSFVRFLEVYGQSVYEIKPTSSQLVPTTNTFCRACMECRSWNQL